MSCPICRTDLIQPDEVLHCPKCDISYDAPINLKGTSIEEIECIDEKLNVFQAKAGEYTFIVRQPRIEHLPAIRKALSLASEYTYLRYPSLVWKHPEGMCHLPLYGRNYLGKLYLIMMLDDKIVGFSHHTYWMLNEETKKKTGFPVPIWSTMTIIQLAVLDPYQRQGIGTLYAKVSEYIAKHNDSAFIMGETFKEGGMLNIRLKDEWKIYSERKAEDGTTRTLIGKPLT